MNLNFSLRKNIKNAFLSFWINMTSESLMNISQNFDSMSSLCLCLFSCNLKLWISSFRPLILSTTSLFLESLIFAFFSSSILFFFLNVRKKFRVTEYDLPYEVDTPADFLKILTNSDSTSTAKIIINNFWFSLFQLFRDKFFELITHSWIDNVAKPIPARFLFIWIFRQKSVFVESTFSILGMP